MSDGNLPTFILVGAMKCGTTSLHQYLGAHPQICTSTPKEPDFFLARNEKDLTWYRRCFAGEAREYGEASTSYTKYPKFRGVPERMNRLLPDLKLLYLVRDPIERALSHYVHNRIDGRETRSVDEAFRPAEKSHYLQTSRYHLQLSRYLRLYPRERLLVVASEQLWNHRAQVLRDIFEFLSVEPGIESAAVEKEYHTTSGKLNPAISSFINETSIGRALKSAGQSLLPQSVIERGLSVFRRDVERPTLPDELERRVRSYLAEDVRQLRTLTGKDFASWSV